MPVNHFSFSHKYILLVLGFISIVVLGFLSACSPTVKPVAPVETENITSGFIMLDVVEVEPTGNVGKMDAIVSTTPDSFVIMLGGSGSCPPMVDSISYDEVSNSVSIVMFEYPPDTMCTRDYRQYFYEVTLIDDVISEGTVFKLCVRDECFVL